MDGRENAERVILSAITAGLLEEWTPITANQTEPALLQSTSGPSIRRTPPPRPPPPRQTPPSSLPGSITFPVVITIQWPDINCSGWVMSCRHAEVEGGRCQRKVGYRCRSGRHVEAKPPVHHAASVLFVHPRGFICLVPAHLAGGGGENYWCWCGAASSLPRKHMADQRARWAAILTWH